jgi:hypothetical protein
MKELVFQGMLIAHVGFKDLLFSNGCDRLPGVIRAYYATIWFIPSEYQKYQQEEFLPHDPLVFRAALLLPSQPNKSVL